MASKAVRRLRFGGLSVFLLLVLLLVSLHLMSSAVQNSAELSRFFVPLLVINLVGMFILILLIGYNSIQLIRQYLRHQAGSRLTVRMVLIFVMISLAPVGVVYYYSFSFLQGGIDSWFDVRIDQAMEDARKLGQASLDLNQRIWLKYTEQLMQYSDDTSESALSLTVADLRPGAVADRDWRPGDRLLQCRGHRAGAYQAGRLHTPAAARGEELRRPDTR